MSTRPTAVAGTFYDNNPSHLQANVRQLLDRATPHSARPAKALIVPHAGYRYSGATAAAGYRQLVERAAEIDRVILLGPAHRVHLQGIAAPSVNSFATPLGTVSLAEDLLATALQTRGVCVSDEAHREEHSLEVQLPFLQVVLGQFSLLPLVVGRCPPELLGQLVDTLWGGPETLFVISSDLSHFLAYDAAVARDRATCQAIVAGATDLDGQQACGAAPINGFLSSRQGAALSCELLGYCNSGDSTGDKQRVVGYGAFMLS